MWQKRVNSVTHHVVGIAVNKQTKDKILVKRINVQIEQIQHFEGRDSLLKQVKKNEGMISKKNKGDGAVKKKHQVQLKHPALHPEKHFVRTSRK